jgi:Ca2+-binding RTX toxin-like protein
MALDGAQSASTVAATPDGGFVIGFYSASSTASSDVLARAFDAAGVAQGSGPVRISDGAGSDSELKIVHDGTGFTAVWIDSILSATPGTGGVFSRSFATFPAADFTTEGDVVSDVNMGTFGGFTDVAVSNGVTGTVWLNGAGQSPLVNLKIGTSAEVQIGNLTADFHGVPQIAALPGGGFVVTWSEIANNNPDVYAQIYDGAGIAQSDAFLVPDTASNENSVDVSVMDDGRILFTWDASEPAGVVTRGRFFDPRTEAINRIGDAFNNQYVGTSFTPGDTLAGVAGHDMLWGMGGGDTLDGGAGRDTLFGGGGADLIETGRGRDTVSGGGGADDFLYASAPARANIDHITDFARRADQFLLDDLAFGSLGTAVTEGEFVRGTAALDRNDRLIYDRDTGRLWYDADGNGAGAKALIAILDNQARLTFADFEMI